MPERSANLPQGAVEAPYGVNTRYATIAVLGYPCANMASPSSATLPTTAAPGSADGCPLLQEIAAFQKDCHQRYRFNSRWDNALNAGGILLSVCIITAGVYNRSDFSTILGGLVAAIVTAQRAFPFGQRATFYRILIGKVGNLQTDLATGLSTIEVAVNTLKALRLDYAQQLPVGTATPSSSSPQTR